MTRFDPTSASRAVLIEVMNVKAKFAALDSVGPSWAAKIAVEHGEDYAQWQRSAFEFAHALFGATEANELPGG